MKKNKICFICKNRESNFKLNKKFPFIANYIKNKEDFKICEECYNNRKKPEVAHMISKITYKLWANRGWELKNVK